MKLFGQFLIEQGLISKEDYVKAMVAQATELPSLPSAVNELKLLTLDQQVEAFDYQSMHLKDYRVACVELGFWDEETFDHALVRLYLAKLRPLGDLLVEQGSLSVKQLGDALSRYVELADYQPTSKPQVKTESAPKQTDTRRDVKAPFPSASTCQDPFVFSPVEKTICYLYCRHFNDARFESLLQLAKRPSETQRHQACQDLQAIRTAAGMIGAEQCRNLIDSLLKVVEKPNPELDSDLLIDQAIRLLWELREGFSAGVPEVLALQNKELSRQVQSCLSTLSEVG